MQLDHLQVDLRPRPNPQALDLGFALLWKNAFTVYAVWLSLWLPLISLATLAAIYMPALGFWVGGWWLFLAWWILPLLERAPLYVISRQVFGESVSWQQTLRAWPRECRGGLWRLLGWWRFFSAGRSLYQAIWQLEGARGASVQDRIRVIGNNTIAAATLFGFTCLCFVIIVEFGAFAIWGSFASDQDSINPFEIFNSIREENLRGFVLFMIFNYALALALIGPIHVACGFALYLNRRASVEAWDIEIGLRQLPVLHTAGKVNKKALAMVPIVAVFVCCGLISLGPEQSAQAAVLLQTQNLKPTPLTATDTLQCSPPKQYQKQVERQTEQSPEQAELRAEIDRIFLEPDFRPFECVETWVEKDQKSDNAKAAEDKKNQNADDKKNASGKNEDAASTLLALILKVVAIGALVFFIVWLILRYRGQGFLFASEEKPLLASEVGGLDIRPESLPENIAQTVRQMWAAGQQRDAVALLYRATLSRLLEHHAVEIGRGATEDDCLQLAAQAHHGGTLDHAALKVVENCTLIWLRTAYAHRLPEEITALCRDWEIHFAERKKVGAFR